MANRFYIPPENNRMNNLLNIANIGARLYMGSQENERGKAREKLMQEQNDLLSQGKALEERKAVSMFGGTLPDESAPGGRLVIPREQGTEIMKAQAVKSEAERNVAKQETEMPSSKPFDSGSIERFRGLILNKAAADGVDKEGIKAINDVWNNGPFKVLEPYVRDQNVRKGDAFNEITNPATYNRLYDSAIQGYRQKYEELVLKDPTQANSPTGKALLTAIDEFEKDRKQGTLIQYFFQDVIDEKKFKAADAAAKVKQPDALIQNYTLAKEQGYKGSIVDYQKEIAAATRQPLQPQKLVTWQTPDGQSVQLPPGQVPPKGSREIGALSGTAPGDDQVEVLANGILDGTIDPSGISKRGNLQGAVWAKVKEKDPTFNIVEAGGSAKFKTASQTMQTKALLNSINPLLDRLLVVGAALENSDFPGYNRAVNFLKEQTGSADIVAFKNLRDDTVAEIERGLLGSGVLSDFKYHRAIKNINDAQSYKQLEAAVNNTHTVIQARLEALDKGPFNKGEKPKEPEAKTVIEKRKTKDGRTLVKYSDGSVGQE